MSNAKGYIGEAQKQVFTQVNGAFGGLSRTIQAAGCV